MFVCNNAQQLNCNFRAKLNFLLKNEEIKRDSILKTLFFSVLITV